LDFNRTAVEVFNHIRGLSPFPGAYTMLEGKRFKLYGAKLTGKKTNRPAGEILTNDEDGISVATADEAVLITEGQLAGKKKTAANDFGRNRQDLTGTVLG